MTRQQLIQLIKAKQSFLCVGLDSDINKIPAALKDTPDPVYAFNRQIIDATLPYAVAYKPNLAFYESNGLAGMRSLYRTMEYLADRRAECFTIADAKRGDIGNTSDQYARAFFSEDGLNFDAITVAPYMGEDSVAPFLKFDSKWAIVLALTSNNGAADFQTKPLQDGGPLFTEVLRATSRWGTPDNLMYVVGATRAEMLTDIRKIVPDHFLLVPGVGAQGGSLEEVGRYGLNSDCGLLVNASRSIIFASVGDDFAETAAAEARTMQQAMSRLLVDKGML